MRKFFGNHCRNRNLLLTFLRFWRIIIHMEANKKLTIYLVRAVLIALTALTLFFILRNGLATGETSAAESHAVTETVQEVVGAIDPDSPIATATGEEFDALHASVRTFAHFFEYFLLGLFSFGAFLSFALPNRWKFAFLPPCLSVVTIALDECLQGLTAGRAAQLLDVLVDMAGSAVGAGVALLIFSLLQVRGKRKCQKQTQ